MGPANASIDLLTVQFTVRGVVVSAQTNLPTEEALTALATVAPLDLASQPIEPSVPPR
ncbi:MAG TPA: hypothetical protein VM121_10490 [Acidimicrobiales bacterium]|nr:hypothetical protein [Acidimicrobiales bacterium]